MKELSKEEQLKLFKDINSKRKTAKSGNFCMTYGGGVQKVSETCKINFEQGQVLHNAYWDFNKAVKLIANDVITKTVQNQLWLFNPISGLWIYVKNKKDLFSSLNQSSGNFCFNVILKHIQNNIGELGHVIFQYHDNPKLCRE